jgi:hypothetical protein
MLTQPIESAFSRVANGNFTNYLAFWEGHALRIGVKSAVVLVGEPRCFAEFDGPFKHLVQYSDLPVYPSKTVFSNGLAYPITMTDLKVGRFDVVSGAPWLYPFGYQRTGGTEIVPAGESVILDAIGPTVGGVIQDNGTGVYSGEYRISRVADLRTAYIHPVTVPMPFVVESKNGFTAFYNGGGEFFIGSPKPVFVKITEDLSDVARPDGTTGIKPGDWFVSVHPRISGFVSGVAGNVLTIGPDPVIGIPPEIPTTMWGPVREWAVGISLNVSILRQAPCCLYDLTLAYTIESHLVTGFPVEGIKINAVKEDGTVVASLEPIVIPVISGPPPRYFRASLGSGWFRYVQRFLYEVDKPFANQYEIAFPDATAANVKITDVALYRGNFTDRFKVGDTSPIEVFSKLEAPVSVESEIIPKGTIIAYTGGPVCPTGYVPVWGLGGEGYMNHVDKEYDDLGELKNIFDLSYSQAGGAPPVIISGLSRIFPVSQDEPRTLIELKNVHRDTSIPPLPFQKWGRMVSVTPYRVNLATWTSGEPPCMAGPSDADKRRQWAEKLIRARAEIGDPDPIWADGTYMRADILPGFILEIRYPDRSFYSIITQYAEGNLPYGAYENAPPYPFGYQFSRHCNHKSWVAAKAAVANGANKNETYHDYGIYGSFEIQRRREVYLEVMGDWLKVLTDAYFASKGGTDVQAHVWKTGVLAHAQNVKEIRDNSYLNREFGQYAYDGIGGYSYFGEAHSHQLASIMDIQVGDVGQAGEGSQESQMPTQHSHGWMFGAVSLPKIRPVLLCQRI